MIEFFAEHDPITGRVFQCLAIERPYQGDFMENGHTYIALSEPIDWSAQPTPSCEMRIVDGVPQWVETATLANARAHAWAAVKIDRDAAESADFDYAGVLYQPDVTKITGAVLAAMLPRPADAPPFSIDWTVSDNSVVTLDATQVIGLGLTLTARINAIHQQGRTLRALIDNAATTAEAYEHTWESLNAE